MAIKSALSGTLGSNAERKVSKSGKPYLRMNVRSGEGDAPVWVSVLAFDQDAIKQADGFVKGAAVYCEGRLTPTSWTSDNGAVRHGLSVMASYCRLAQIGRNKPRKKRQPKPDRVAAIKTAAAAAVPFNDEIGF